MRRHSIAILAASLTIAVAAPATAKEIVVQMKNSGASGAMVFEPSLIKAAPGDTIRFKPTDPSHNAETIPTLLPAGAAPMKGAMNKEVTMTVTKAGLYGVKCMPHYSMGMVALVQVGKPTAAEIAAAKALKMPPLATKRMAAILAGVR